MVDLWIYLPITYAYAYLTGDEYSLFRLITKMSNAIKTIGFKRILFIVLNILFIISASFFVFFFIAIFSKEQPDRPTTSFSGKRGYLNIYKYHSEPYYQLLQLKFNFDDYRRLSKYQLYSRLKNFRRSTFDEYEFLIVTGVPTNKNQDKQEKDFLILYNKDRKASLFPNDNDHVLIEQFNIFVKNLNHKINIYDDDDTNRYFEFVLDLVSSIDIFYKISKEDFSYNPKEEKVNILFNHFEYYLKNYSYDQYKEIMNIFSSESKIIRNNCLEQSFIAANIYHDKNNSLEAEEINNHDCYRPMKISHIRMKINSDGTIEFSSKHIKTVFIQEKIYSGPHSMSK